LPFTKATLVNNHGNRNQLTLMTEYSVIL